MPTLSGCARGKTRVELAPHYLDVVRPVVWSIAGSDSSAAAGIQADLLSFQDLGVRACTAVTSLTAQNDVAVYASHPVSVSQLEEQLTALSKAHPPAAIKLGLLGSVALVEYLVDYLATLNVPVIFDPVLRAGSGQALAEDDVLNAQLAMLPLCTVLTPNIPEAEALCGCSITHPGDMVKAAHKLCDKGAHSVLLKGGHARFGHTYCWDYWTDGNTDFWLRSRRRTGNYRGTGCSLSAALAAALVNGWSTALDDKQRLYDALVMACAYVQHGLRCATSERSDAVVHGNVDLQACDLPKICTEYGQSLDYNIPPWSGPEIKLYPVVADSTWVTKLATLGVRTLQLRIKSAHANRKQLNAQISEAQSASVAKGARLIVNDYWDLAIAHGSYGVHLGQSDLLKADLSAIADAGLRVGISTHGWWELARALSIGPSYVAFGPVFKTTSKPMPFAPIGIDRLAQWSAITAGVCPRVAIGGISEDNAADVVATGVDGVAAIGAISGSKDWQASVMSLQKLLG